MKYVVAYDVPDDGVRGHITEAIDDYGVRVQLSVFECELGTEELFRLRAKLEEMLRGQLGASVRFYALCERCSARVVVLGASGEAAGESPFVVI